MLFQLNPDNPQKRLIEQVRLILSKDGVIIYPTDSSYSFGCSINSRKAMERIYRLKKIDIKLPLTFICKDFGQFQEYTNPIDNHTFRRLNPHLPGPYTMIFPASKLVPKKMLSKHLTIGVRIPHAPIALDLVESLGEPLLSSSIPHNSEEIQNPEVIYDFYKKKVEAVIDGGEVLPQESSVIDFTEECPYVLRKGRGDTAWVENF